MYKQDLALNNLQGLRCHKVQPTNKILFYVENIYQNKFFEKGRKTHVFEYTHTRTHIHASKNT